LVYYKVGFAICSLTKRQSLPDFYYLAIDQLCIYLTKIGLKQFKQAQVKIIIASRQLTEWDEKSDI